MTLSRFISPYKKNGRTNYKDAWQRSGIYLIKENGKVVYVGHSQNNLYKTLYRHFQHWYHKLQYVVTYKGRMNQHRYTVAVEYLTSAQAVRKEHELLLKYRPRDNKAKLLEALKMEAAKKQKRKPKASPGKRKVKDQFYEIKKAPF